MKVLILGAKGSLGQVFTELYKDEEVSSWDRDELDITDEGAVREKIVRLKPDLIINCAAYNTVDKAEEDRATTDTINGYAVGYIAKAASDIEAILVHFSSAYVFKGNKADGYNEEDLPDPKSAYAKSKLLGEMELQENYQNFYIIRTTWLYGRESIAGKTSFIDLMLKLAHEGKEIRGITDEFGQPTYVVDLAKATKELIEIERPYGIYHLTNSGSCSWYDWAREIFKIKNIQTNLTKGKRLDFNRPAARPQYGILINTKTEQLRPWHEALKEYLS